MINSPAKAEGEPYDARKRDPQYAHASSSPLWELVRTFLFSFNQPRPDHFSIDSATEPLPPCDITTCPTTLVLPTSHSQRGPLTKHALTLPRPIRIQKS